MLKIASKEINEVRKSLINTAIVDLHHPQCEEGYSDEEKEIKYFNNTHVPASQMKLFHHVNSAFSLQGHFPRSTINLIHTFKPRYSQFVLVNVSDSWDEDGQPNEIRSLRAQIRQRMPYLPKDVVDKMLQAPEIKGGRPV